MCVFVFVWSEREREREREREKERERDSQPTLEGTISGTNLHSTLNSMHELNSDTLSSIRGVDDVAR
jgi:hypothetical protein